MACMETQSRTQYLIPVQSFFINNCCIKQRNVIGPNWSQLANYGQNRTVRWHRPCMVGIVLFKPTVLAPSCTVQIRYGPSRRSNKPKDGAVAQ